MADPLLTSMSGSMGLGPLAAVLGAFFVVFLIVCLALYIYMAIALMVVANKVKVKNSWLAFIPIANIWLMTQVGGISGWWTLAILLGVIPFVGALAIIALMIYIWWKIAEAIRKPGWWGILMIIPVVNLVIVGVMAWGK